jgi:hypothetical protein
MPPEKNRVLFAGLDPVPIPLTVPKDATDEAIFAAACMPSSSFIQTIRPYRLCRSAADTYQLVIGPEGFGAVLLEALQWLARVAAAGILGAIARDQTTAFVQHYLEVEKPEWRFEELTEHAATFVDDRYQRAARDAAYRQELERSRHTPRLAALVDEIRDWVAQHS